LVGTLIFLSEVPDGVGGEVVFPIIFIVLVQILMLLNLIILNKRNSGSTSHDEEQNSDIKDGLFEQFYDNGNIKIRGNYVNGKKDGLWESFYYDGSSSGRQTFKEGREIF
jgi:hypothetical protein